ncbi:redox-regulated ATPase YchF [bacterium]|nr:redox-regulated ATPase YchF [bacterium]
MGFKCGFIGLPNTGKSTIFNALTNLHVEASAYPFCTIDPHFGIVPLEDERLNQIYRIVGSKKKSFTSLEFVDIAGLVQDASKGEGLGNQFLSHIGQVDAIAHIVRCFEDPNVSHPYSSLDPVRDARTVTTELILKDIETVEKRLSKYRTASKSGDTQSKKMVASLEPIFNGLSSEIEVRNMNLDDDQKQILKELNLLTAKPVIFIANIDENHLERSPLVKSLQEHAISVNASVVTFCGKVQAEIAELNQEDQLIFLKAMNLEETGLQKLVKTGYHVLHLITFFTANENEAVAWTIPEGTSVQKAAGKVHTDFEKGFIKAEVIQYDDLLQYGSVKILHDRGLVSIHGKDYVVQDGNLIFFRVKH